MPKKSKSSISTSKVLKSKTFQYITLSVAIMNILVLISNKKYNAVLFAALFGILTYYFTKNMNIVFLSSVMFSHLFSCFVKTEGFKEGSSSNEQDKDENKYMEGMDDNKDTGAENIKCVGDDCKKESLSKIRPSSLDPDDELEDIYIDKSSTIDKAYDNLEQILGKGGMEKLSNETESLVKRQGQLMQAMQSMGPMMKSVQNLIGGMNKNGEMDEMQKTIETMANTTKKHNK